MFDRLQALALIAALVLVASAGAAVADCRPGHHPKKKFGPDVFGQASGSYASVRIGKTQDWFGAAATETRNKGEDRVFYGGRFPTPIGTDAVNRWVRPGEGLRAQFYVDGKFVWSYNAVAKLMRDGGVFLSGIHTIPDDRLLKAVLAGSRLRVKMTSDLDDRVLLERTWSLKGATAAFKWAQATRIEKWKPCPPKLKKKLDKENAEFELYMFGY